MNKKQIELLLSLINEKESQLEWQKEESLIKDNEFDENMENLYHIRCEIFNQYIDEPLNNQTKGDN